MHRRFCLFMCLVLLMTGWNASFAKAETLESAPLVKASTHNGMVRVYLQSMGSPTRLDVTIAGSYTADGAYDAALSSGETVRVDFDPSSGQISMNRNGATYDMGREMVFRRHAVSGSSGLRIAQTRMPDNLYPGDLQLVARQSGGAWRLYAIVHVYIEYYLYGVVPYEMGNSAHIEALKAQAVAARTYTLNRMNLRANNLYDVVDTTNDQVYYGNSDSTKNCTAAVDATKGIVAMNGGELTGTYYTASNGGQTESAVNGLNASGYSYLVQKDDPFDLMNPASVVRSVTVYADHAAQSQAVRDLLDPLARTQFGSDAVILRINAITPHTPRYAAPSRLYRKLDFDVTVRKGNDQLQGTLTVDIFTQAESELGMSINSRDNELWSVEAGDGTFRLRARRFGHGVGMSQRGAMQMGAMGYTYDQILAFYYEGCRRVQYTFTHTVLSSPESGGSNTITTTEKPADIIHSGENTARVQLSSVSDRLAVRAAANEKASVLTSIVNGGMVSVLAKGDAWTLVRLGSIVGYVPTSALQFSGTPPTSSAEKPTIVTQWATVDCEGTLNLRSSSAMSAGVLAAIPDGTVLCVFSVQNGWAKVQYGASVGWASTDFLRMSNVYPGTAAGQGTSKARVTTASGTGTVNLRESASTTARVLSNLGYGSTVTVLSNDGSWCFVRAGSFEGYMMTRYLDFGSDGGQQEEQLPQQPSNGQEAIVRTPSGTLNLREAASTAARIIMTIPRGESIVVTGRGESWCAVRYAGMAGYVMTTYLHFPDDESTEPAGYATVALSSGVLNMRRQPSIGSSVVMQLPRGTRVGVLEQADGWTRILYQGSTGYVMSSYLAKEGSGEMETPHFSIARVSTASGSLNLRESPSATARVLAWIPQNTILTVEARQGEWAKTSYAGRTGYVMQRYLTFIDEQEQAPSDAWVDTGSGGLNLRENASPQARVLLTIPDQARLELLSSGAEWCRVRYLFHTGYVMTRYISMTQPGAAVWRVATPGGGLNLRESASAQARVLLVIPQGSEVTVLEAGETWCKIQYYGYTGYVMTDYLRKE